METLKIVKTLSELAELDTYLDSLDSNDFIAFDTETNGAEHGSMIIGFSICADINLAYYVILYYWDVAQQKLIELVPKDKAKPIIEKLINRPLVMQNAPFDCEMTNTNFGIELMPYVVHDTMIGGHILNENRYNGLKERGVELFGEDAVAEQRVMKESVSKNGGVLTKEKYELYKADADLLAHYGAKDAILTLNILYNDAPLIAEENLSDFFYNDESMPLLRGPTYDMNRTGLKVDGSKLLALKYELQAECLADRAFIYQEIDNHVKEKYPGTRKTNKFNIDACQQRAWLLYIKLENPFHSLTKGGRELCKEMEMRMPYSLADKRDFIHFCTENKNRVYMESKFNPKTKKMSRPKKIGDPWKYMACGKESLKKLSDKYKWVERYLQYAKNNKILNTYVEGIETRMKYGIIRPSFLQHGTTSGRYSSKNPNFQNLPRDDKRVKACIIARPGKVFVGADYSQLEPRVFAYFSGDRPLLDCFKNGDDFYSVIGATVFDKLGYSLKKDLPESFAKKFPKLRDIAKVVALSSTYGTTAFKMAPTIGKATEEAQEIIDDYFTRFPGVKDFMLSCHEEAKNKGLVRSLFGRPRRMPKALAIKKLFGNTRHSDLPYEIRNILNLAVNHKVQSTGASIMNRAAIAFWKACKELAEEDKTWDEVRIVMQVHDELIAESPTSIAEDVRDLMKHCMEETNVLPGVELIAEPKIANNLADLK